MKKITNQTKQEKFIDNMQLEAERIGNWLNKSDFPSFNAEHFIVSILLNIDNVDLYELQGILEESKNAIRDIILSNNEENK